MSDSFVALVDVTASPKEAKRLAPLIVECLSSHGLIEPTLSEEPVLGGHGYPAGPACSKAYVSKRVKSRPPPIKFWELVTSGVEVHSDRWVNVFGFTVFESAVCPGCGHGSGEEFLDGVGAGVEEFNESGKLPTLSCPKCAASAPIHDWKCTPFLGFVNLAVVFWNWPPFDDAAWKLDVPALLSAKIGRPLVPTHGHL